MPPTIGRFLEEVPMAKVNVEQSVFFDPRYRILAVELGVDIWSAIGRMTAVWHQCLETNAYVLSEAIVNHQFDDAPSLSAALLKSGLGKKHRHGIYICGTKGRIEWLAKKRLQAQENGRKSSGRPVTKAKPTDNQHRLQPVTPSVTASVTASVVKKKTPSESKKKEIGEKEFETVWAEYPNRVGRKAALKHFRSSVNTPEDLVAIRLALENYKASRRVREGYVQDGSTWFNGWRDFLSMPSSLPTFVPIGGFRA